MSDRFDLYNGNRVALVSIKTTGINPFRHELVSICVIVLDQLLNPDKRYPLFHCDIIPSRPENIDWEEETEISTAPNFVNIDRTTIIKGRARLSGIAAKGLERFQATDLFERWFEKIGLAERKKLFPLAHNWKFSAPFIMDWLGGPLNMNYIFDSRYRDVASTALFLNDYADFHHRKLPFPKINLKYLCSQLNIEHEHNDDPMQDCLIIRDIYKAMLTESIL